MLVKAGLLSELIERILIVYVEVHWGLTARIGLIITTDLEATWFPAKDSDTLTLIEVNRLIWRDFSTEDVCLAPFSHFDLNMLLNLGYSEFLSGL